MARINIENNLFTDNRFTDLILKMGSRRMALGALIEAYILAQQYFLTTVNDRLIPLNEWQRQRIADEIIEVGLAEIRDKGVYVSGSNEQFGWLLQRSEAGKASAAAKKVKADTQRPLTTVERPLRDGDGSQPLSLSLSLSQVNTKNNINYEAGTNNEAGQKFFIVPELSRDDIDDVLCRLNPRLQRQWLKTFKDPEFIKNTIAETVSFYTGRGDAIEEVLATKLNQSLYRQNQARLNAKAPKTKGVYSPDIYDKLEKPKES